MPARMEDMTDPTPSDEKPASDASEAIQANEASSAGEAAPADDRGKRTHWLGRTLYYLGLLSLPGSVGAALGFYAADRGLPWLPHMLEIILGVLVFGLLAVPAGYLLGDMAFKKSGGVRKFRTRVLVCLVLAALGLVGRLAVHWLDQPSPLTELSRTDFNRAYQIDFQRYVEYDRGLEKTVRFLEGRTDMFPASGGEVLTAEQERVLLDAWATVYDYAFSLDQIRIFYEDYYRFDPSRAERSRHLRSFLLTFAAELALYEKSSRLTTLILRNENAVKFLDSPHPDRRLAADSFTRFRQELAGQRDLARVLAGEQYLKLLETGLGARAEALEYGCTGLWKRVDGHLAAVHVRSAAGLGEVSAGADLSILRGAIRRVWFPAQSKIAEFMGDARVRRIGVYLISQQQLEEMRKHLEPGDVILCRKNWYLSNVGLPGFWPHAALYIGTPGSFDAYFDDPEVKQYVRDLAGKQVTLAEYIRSRWPVAAGAHLTAEDGQPREVIEAVSEGVLVNTLKHASGDYLAVMRPQLSKLTKARAIIAAFSHVGKPYDFDFDFATDHALVCTEVVWRSYRPSAPGKPGLKFKLVDVVGRKTLPANEMARLFAAEHGKANAQMKFVYYLAGREKQGQAVVADEAEFLKTHKLTKWSIRLE
jgi:uncharacterized protein YycO